MTQEGNTKDDPTTPHTTTTDSFAYLASSNFSSDSINEKTTFTPLLPGPTLVSPNQPSHKRSNVPRRQRPVSAFLMDSNNLISEDGTDNPIYTPRNRNSMTFEPFSYTPPPPPAQRSTSPVRMPVQRSTSPVRLAPPVNSPFNFKPQEVQLATPSQSLKPAHRKGHKYKHSSVSMNFFQEPPPSIETTQAIPGISDHFIVPTFKETINSLTHTQKLRLTWSGFHVAVSLLIFMVGFHYKLPALSTLSHLVFYDSLGSIIIVVVDIMSNFDVWNKSSITFPFGLGRIEVLAGFALSSWLIMVAFDLYSHLIEEAIFLLVDSDVDHGASHHVHPEVGGSSNWVVYQAVLILTLVVCLVSSNYILGFDRISEMMNKSDQPQVGKGLSIDSSQQTSKFKNILTAWRKNPTNVVTITYTIFLSVSVIIPTSLTSDLAMDINEIGTLLLATFLCFNGWKLVKLLGGILLCSFPYSDHEYYLIRSKIINTIEQSDWFKSGYHIDRLFITKFNYRVVVVGMKINMIGFDVDEEVRVRFEINRIITRELEKLEGKIDHEITIDIDRV
ncbi:Protein ZRG17 [Spathaspora sp. JA1]|nr:Protein ZRG17 [Spathaspora sp. JA1]